MASENDDILDYDDFTEGSDDYRVTPADFADIFVIPSDWNVSTLRGELDEIVDLDPAFQRRSVWSLAAKSKFIESLILGIPIPQILLAESHEQRNHYLVLDGKQRLLTIKEFFQGRLSDGVKFRLTGLNDLSRLNGRDWDGIVIDFPKDARAIDAAQIRTAIIRGWRNDNILYEIFHRLNSGSVRLSPMELRMALVRGPFIASVVRKTSEEAAIQAMLGLRVPDKRMRDVEIAIRHMAFNDGRVVYAGNLKEFLDEYCRLRNVDYARQGENLSDLDELNAAIAIGLEAFGPKFFSRRYLPDESKFDRPFNRAAFDVIAGSLVNRAVQDAVRKKPESFVKLWQQACDDANFRRAIEVTTKSIDATRERFTTWYGFIKKAITLIYLFL
ncbi:DUF262 domain-containing protein [Sphingobium chungbukense]|uniref:GmrSD restriction endonucleases N-terminal domain-containing protein n=1 Tax=Sphingobium chungbukense TaxID=56193 RepID=A0A0M3ATH3_9SPHN|nr:DUF262 domain-containing protein [Sphingobium chungbukense]KKW92231.1 hypothetical protein YP76_09840 [Sphingobium chungbukense]